MIADLLSRLRICRLEDTSFGLKALTDLANVLKSAELIYEQKLDQKNTHVQMAESEVMIYGSSFYFVMLKPCIMIVLVIWVIPRCLAFGCTINQCCQDIRACFRHFEFEKSLLILCIPCFRLICWGMRLTLCWDYLKKSMSRLIIIIQFLSIILG